jgi:hypothetical protein
VYGGAPPAHDPARAPAGIAGYESSGSLTGHILAQGHPDTPQGGSGRGSKAVIIIMVIMVLLVVGGFALGAAWLSGAFH